MRRRPAGAAPPAGWAAATRGSPPRHPVPRSPPPEVTSLLTVRAPAGPGRAARSHPPFNCAARPTVTHLQEPVPAAARAPRLLLVPSGGSARCPAGRRRGRGGGGASAGAEGHVVGVLAPAPGVDHEVAEAGAGRDRRGWRRLLVSPPRGRFDRGGFDNGNQDALRGVLAENHRGPRRQPLRHR